MTRWSQAEHVRVSSSATRIEQGYDGNGLWVDYDLGAWVVHIQADAQHPFDGPSYISVGIDLSDERFADSIDSAEGTGGISTEVLRSVPLQDARAVLRRLRTEVRSAQEAADDRAYVLPDRMRSVHDWLRFAQLFIRAQWQNPTAASEHLASRTGLSRNTVEARVRRVRELGLLAPADPPPGVRGRWLELAPRAISIQNGEANG